MNVESILTKGNIDPVSFLHYTLHVLNEGIVATQYNNLITNMRKYR